MLKATSTSLALGLALTMNASPALAACPGGNLLTQHRAESTEAVERAERLTDGWQTLDGMPWDHPDSLKLRGEMTWDMGQLQQVGAAELQSDGNDEYVVSVSADGTAFDVLWRASGPASAGLVTRRWTGPSVAARYVRLKPEGGDGLYSATEFRVGCTPEGLAAEPVMVRHNQPLTDLAKRQQTGFAVKLVILLAAMLGIPLLCTKAWRQWRVAGAALLIALSALSYTNFLTFNGTSALHVPDAFHYFMGPKYFRATGYFELYRCVGQAERELGHALDYQTALVRDLDDNRIWPGQWLSTENGRCRAKFDDAQWQAFKRDVAAFRQLLVGQASLPRLLADHGFNGTPYHATFIRAFAIHLPANSVGMHLLAQLDTLALIGAVMALWWGFGPLGAALFAVMLGAGSFWGYGWVGGTIARHTWLFWTALGLAAARRRRVGLATVALTLAGLHRVFPLFFLLAYFAWLGARALRARWWLRPLRRAAVAFGLTLLFATTATVSTIGTSAFSQHLQVLARHADSPGGNRLGLPLLFATYPGGFASNLADSRLSDPAEIWVRRVKDLRAAHWPLRAFGMLLAALLVARVARRGSAWETILAVGPMLYALQDITSYDFVWLCLLAPLGLARAPLRRWLLAFVGLTTVVTQLLVDVELQHFICNVALLALLATIGFELWRQPRVTRAS